METRYVMGMTVSQNKLGVAYDALLTGLLAHFISDAGPTWQEEQGAPYSLTAKLLEGHDDSPAYRIRLFFQEERFARRMEQWVPEAVGHLASEISGLEETVVPQEFT